MKVDNSMNKEKNFLFMSPMQAYMILLLKKLFELSTDITLKHMKN